MLYVLLLAGLKDGLLDAPARVKWEGLATLVMGLSRGQIFLLGFAVPIEKAPIRTNKTNKNKQCCLDLFGLAWFCLASQAERAASRVVP
jgi:hypothetical protein